MFVQKMIMTRDINGYVTYGLPFTEFNYFVVLAADTAQTLVTVPDDANLWEAVFYYQDGTSVYVALNDTAEVPDGTPAQTSSQGKPGSRLVKAGDTVSVITANDSAEVGVSLYAIS
jgi:hypothetical protein